MGLLDLFRANGTLAPLNPDMSEQAFRNALNDAEIRISDLEESLLEVADAFDNIGWDGGIQPQEAKEFSLKTVKSMALIARAVNITNPFVKKGVEARISYIWGDGVEFKNLDASSEKLIKDNYKRVFSPQAYEEQERAAATDGNVFRAVSRSNKPIIRIPLEQIAGKIANPDNSEEVWYYKREWEVKKTRLDDGSEDTITNVRYYPSITYAKQLEDANKNLPTRLNKAGVEQDYVMQHMAVNKQIGWAWGVPDILPVIFFAKVYKEYLEDNVTLVKAYSRIAMQVKADTGGTANAVSAAYSKAPTRDPITGELRGGVGATAVTGTGTEMVPLGLNASAVDFTGGDPLAVGIAAGLLVSKTDILPDVQPGAMPVTTLKAMASRQNFWGDSFIELFEFWGEDDVEITWGQIDEDETHRRVQSVQLAYDGGQLFQEESRAETLKTLKMVPTKDGLPVAPAIVAAQAAADNAVKVAAATPVTPGQGKSGSVGSVNSGRGQVKAAVKKSMVNK